MAVPQKLLQQLLALDESVRLEIAHTLIKSVDVSTDDGMDTAEREKLYAALAHSIEQAERGQTVPFDDVMATLRAKRTARAMR
jgi:hypothetical protein